MTSVDSTVFLLRVYIFAKLVILINFELCLSLIVTKVSDLLINSIH